MNDQRFMRLYRAEPDLQGDNEAILFVAATAGLKGDRVDLGSGIPWDFSRGIEGDLGPRYPFLWVHDLAGRNLPLGVADVLTAPDELPMRVAVTFDPEDDLAMRVRAKYLSPVGGLAGISVSWDDVGEDGIPVRATAKKVAARQLLEISAVPVGLDPDALKDGARTELVEHLRALEVALEGLTEDMVAGARDAARAAERPYPSEHACRLRDPGEFDEKSFRRVRRETDAKPYAVIMGKLKGEDAMTEQAYRYPTDDWTADEAREHCESHDGATFEEAAPDEDRRTEDGDRASAAEQASAPPARAVKGSFEEKAERIADAIKAAGIFGSSYIWVLATMDDSVIVAVYTDESPVRYFRVHYTEGDDGAITIGEWVRVNLVQIVEDANVSSDSRGDGRSVSDEDLWRACAAAMVDVFDRGSDDSDEKRRRLYNALLPAYRRAQREPPEWVGGDELRAVDDDN